MKARQLKRIYKPEHKMIFSTAKITCQLEDGHPASGTGFFYKFNVGNHLCPVLVTNKHVIEKSVSGSFVVSKMDKRSEQRAHTDMLIKDFQGFSDGWITHPSSNVDLCILPLKPWLEDLHRQDIIPYIAYNESSNIPRPREWQCFRPFEKVMVVGYPDGIWDSNSNLPISTQGLTATPASVDFYGHNFLINAPIYTGSSGSPVYLYDKEVKLHKEKGNYTLTQKPRIRLLGIASGFYSQTLEGALKRNNIPLSEDDTSQIKIPMNLGEVIKSTTILEFWPLLRAMEAKVQAYQ